MPDQNSIHVWRRAIQTAVAVFFILVPLLNANGFKFIWGNFLNIHIGKLIFADPLAVLQVIVNNRYIPPGLLIGAALVLAIAFIMGTIFCSWICPFGLLSELIHSFSLQFRSKKNIEFKFLKNIFAVKAVIFCVGFITSVMFFGSSILNQISLPFQYSNIFQYLFMQAYLFGAAWFLMAILVTEFIFCKRLWCRWICPQSVIVALAGQCNPFGLKVLFAKKNCISSKASPPCKKACSLDLDPRNLNFINRVQCTNCGDCIDACRKAGKALDFGFLKSG